MSPLTFDPHLKSVFTRWGNNFPTNFKSTRERAMSIEKAMNVYLEAIRKNYAKWLCIDGTNEVREEMIREFKVTYTGVDNRYLCVIVKSVGNEFVHSFVVNTKTDKFPYGAILKPESPTIPVRNKSRGNIFKDVSRINWSGAII